MSRIALFGGSFNPPQIAHALACLYVLETADVDALWIVPTWQHPFDKGLVPFEHRYEMCQRLASRIAGCTVSRVEADLGKTSHTLETLRHLLEEHPGDSFTLVVGADVWKERELWYGWQELEKLVPFIVLGRRGYDGPAPMLPEVSSSEVRSRLRTGQDVRALVPRAVLAYIQEKELYL